MEGAGEAYTTLASLLEEFFDDATGNQRKQAIEGTLSTFTGQDGAWRLCVEFMDRSSNEYVSMFCLASLETIITKRWLVLPAGDKAQMAAFLYQHSLDRHARLPTFIRNKLLKLVVDIARHDWPHFYPDFLTNVLSLIQSDDLKTVNLGLAYLLTTSEELICPKEDVNISRKEELRCLLLAHLPQIFTLLVAVLERVRVTAGGEDVVRSALCAASHLFSWMPLQNVHSPELLLIICDLATDIDRAGATALATLNELLYKNCVPHSFLPSLGDIARHADRLLAFLLHRPDLDLNEHNGYVSKLTELVRLLVANHWHRLESNDNFPLLEFLGNFFRYTFHPGAANYMFHECLESWINLVDYLHDKSPDHITRYEEVLLMVAQHTFKKMQTEKEFVDDSEEEQQLEDEECDSDYHEERIFSQCLELIAKIADLVPTKLCNMVLEMWQPACVTYSQLLGACDDLPDEWPPCLVEQLQLLTSMTMALGSMYFNFDPADQPAIVRSLASIAELATRADVHSKPKARPVRLQLIYLHVQLMDALKSWLHANKTDEGLEESVRACVPLLLERENRSPTLQKAAATLLIGVTSLPRPLALLPLLEPLFASPLDHLSKGTWTAAQLALVRCVLLWNWDVGEEATRLQLLSRVVRQVTGDGLKEAVWLLQHCHPDSRDARKLFYAAVQPVLEKSVRDFPLVLANDAENSTIVLKFFLEAFRLFQEFMGGEFTYQAVSIFLSAYQCVDLSEGTCGVDQLLELLTVIVEQPSACYKQFVPSCLELCLDQIYPFVADAPSPQIKPALFKLFKSILIHRWHYFYSGSLLGSESVLGQEDRFKQVLVAFGQSLTQTDIRLFSQNLNTLEALNQKWKLYHKDLFRAEFLGKFLTVLLNNLVEKSHALLSEEIATAVYNMAAVDFHMFFNSFIPHFLAQTEGIDPHQRDSLFSNSKQETDLPSFIQNVQRLANDVRCYRVCNGNAASL